MPFSFVLFFECETIKQEEEKSWKAKGTIHPVRVRPLSEVFSLSVGKSSGSCPFQFAFPITQWTNELHFRHLQLQIQLRIQTGFLINLCKREPMNGAKIIEFS